MRKFISEAGFIVLIDFILAADFILVGLLKLTGRFEERNPEPFPANEKSVIISTNHPDGNEWFFIYSHFFTLRYLLRPRRLPKSIADDVNFKNSGSLAELFKDFLIFIYRRDGDGQKSRLLNTVSIRQCVNCLREGQGLIGFFEGSRTKRAENIVYSEKRGKPLGKINQSIGFLAKLENVKVKTGWIEFVGADYSSLTDGGRFSLIRFIKWYWKTLIGKNGKIVLVWGKLERFDIRDRREITIFIEQSLLRLADEV